MNWRSSALSLLAGAVMIAGVVAGSAIITTKYLGAQTTTADMAGCTKLYTARVVTIRDNLVFPDKITAKLCDTLIITNGDARIRLMAFGVHSHHVPYDGIIEKALAYNQTMRVTLNQIGSFTFHDHLEDDVAGRFTVLAR